MQLVRVAALAFAVGCGGQAATSAPPHMQPPPPPEPAPAPVWMSDEASVFAFVRDRYVELGVQADFSDVRLIVDDHVVLPFYSPVDHAIRTAPFAQDIAGMRAHLARLSVTLLGGAFVLDGYPTDEDAMMGYRGFLVSVMAHELSHHVRFSRPGADQITGLDLIEIEALAEEWELAFVDDLVERGELAPDWRDAIDQLYADVAAAIPPAAALPDGGHGNAAARAFGEAYLAHADALAVRAPGEGTTDLDAAATMFAGYLGRRGELSASHRTLAELVAAENR